MRVVLLIAICTLSVVNLKAGLHPLYVTAEKLYNEQHFDSALMYFNELTQLYPQSKEPYFNRGLCLYKSERYAEAVLDLNECLQYDSSLSVALYLKGICQQQTGELSEGIATFNKINGSDATIFSVNERIKKYKLAVYISTRWYYMVLLAFLSVMFLALIVNMATRAKNNQDTD